MSFGKSFIYILLVAGIVISPSGVAYSAGDDFFLEQTFDIPGVILGFQAADFNGDGHQDLALLTSEDPTKRIMLVYLQRESDRFPPTVSQRFELPPTVNMFQAEDLDGDGLSEIYVIDYDGLRQYRHDGIKFAAKAKIQLPGPTIFTAGIEGAVLTDPFIHVISGRPVVFIPTVSGYQLWEYRGGKFSQFDEIPFTHVVFKGERSVKHFGNAMPLFALRLPEIVVGRRAERAEINLIWPDRLAVFLEGNGGKFSDSEPIHFHFLKSSPGNLCLSKLVDFDLDNRFDLICSQSRGGISGALTEVSFYGSDRLRQASTTATHTISLTDACGNLMIDNFDRTGGLELAVPAVELGTMSTVKMMITKKTDLYLLIYPIDNLGRPSPEPTVRHKMTCRLDFDRANPVEDVRIDWSGDYDGDGLPDLVLADGGGQLMFYRGSAEGYLESKAEQVLNMSSPDIIKPLDLNGDERSDLVIIHKPDQASTRLTLLITNRIM